MEISGPYRRSRCLAVAGMATGGAAALTGLLLEQRRPGGVTTVHEALVEACVLGLVGCVAWAWLGAISVVAECWRGGPARRTPGVPRALRRVLLTACGVVVASALSTTGQAAAGGDADPGSLAGLPMPERALGAAHQPAPPDPTVMVRPGDCLWSLAADDLGPGASATAVDARWRWIYRLNRALIGPDPDLIRPGQLLELPPRP